MTATTARPSSDSQDSHVPESEPPTGSYVVLLSAFASLAGGFAAWFRHSGRPLPERMAAADLALLTVATHKLSRLIAKDRVAMPLRAPFTRYQGKAGPGEVAEAARGRGLRRAVGELLVCPYCLGMWISAGLTAMLLVAPRLTRWLSTVLSVLFGADLLQIAYRRAEDQLSR